LIEKQLADQEDNQQVQEQLLKAYAEFTNVFLKAAFNTLPPQRLYDHKIQLMDDTTNTLSFSPLCH
jgi:hypothetical protein